MKTVPLGLKRVKLSNHHDGIHDYCQKEKVVSKGDEITAQVERPKNNEKEKKNKQILIAWKKETK